MKNHIIRIIGAVLIMEAAYLVLANLALQLAVTQTLVNSIKPDKFAITWEKAWTWYPFRVHARGISANGQTGTQQWQAEAPAASASISILPLLAKMVSIHSVVVDDLWYYQRPRPRTDKDYAAVSAFFPLIKGRDIDKYPITPSPRKKGNGWKITVDGIKAIGNHGFWVYQIQGRVSGVLQASVNYETRGGPFSLESGEMDLAIRSLTINENQMVSGDSFVKGKLEFTPFVPSENRGIQSLAFMQVDAEMDLELGDLDFLNFYLRGLRGMTLVGKGRLSGNLLYEHGALLPPTNLAIVADNLHLDLYPYEAKGNGDVTIRVDLREPEQLAIGVHFAAIELVHRQDDTSHFTGDDLMLTAAGSSKLLPWNSQKSGVRRLSVEIPAVRSPDLKVYQRYIPSKKAFVVEGGEGELEGRAELTENSLTGSMQLRSTAAELSFESYRFTTELTLAVNVDAPSLASGEVDITGTHIKLTNARLIRDNHDHARPWNAILSIDEGHIILPVSAKAKNEGSLGRVSQTLHEHDVKSLLDSAEANFIISGNLSELDWINLLFSNTYKMSIFGSGDLNAELRIDDGLPAAGSVVRIQPNDFGVGVLDYEARGDGLIVLRFLDGGQQPDLDLHVEIADAHMRRRGEDESYISDVTLTLEAQALNVRKGKPGSNLDALRLQISDARISDMSAYNDYLPTNSPLLILGGQGRLNADIRLSRDMADGYIRLVARDMRSRIDEQELGADLQVNVAIRDGTPEKMDFDISGTSFTLDNVKVYGESANYDRENWSAQFQLNEARTIWKKPVYLHAEAATELKDSRPFVALFSNSKGEHKWIEKMLTVEDIKGTVEMTLQNQQLTIPHAFTNSDRIDAGVKGVINATHREGIFYVRYGKLDAILQARDGKRDIDIMAARKKFDEYSFPTETKYHTTQGDRNATPE